MTTESEPERNLFQHLIDLDKDLFYKINVTYSDLGIDSFLIWMRDANSWIFLYIAVGIFVVVKMKWYAVKWFISFFVLIALCDGISSHVLKELFNRPRPFSDASLPLIRLLLDYRPGNASFPSSHAVNHMGGAIFFSYTAYEFYKNTKWIYAIVAAFIIWACIIGYAQIYVGVHYPLDILGGLLIGLAIGWLHHLAFDKWVYKAYTTKPTNFFNILK